MLVLSILAGVTAVAATVYGLIRFHCYCCERFRYSFFGLRSFGVAIAAVTSAYAGFHWWRLAFLHRGDQLNGGTLLVLGAAGVIWLLLTNVRRTNLYIGLVGSVLQGALFTAYFVIGVIAIPMYFGLAVLASVGAWPVYVVNR